MSDINWQERAEALQAKLDMTKGLMAAAEQANELAKEAFAELVKERDALAAEGAGLKSAAKTVIKMNRQHAKDKYGDPAIAESWACVKVLRKAKGETPATDAWCREMQVRGVVAFAGMYLEPVAWRRFRKTPSHGGYWSLYDDNPNDIRAEPLYTAPRPALTNGELIDTAIELAGEFYQMQGYAHRPGFKYWQSTHPQERLMFEMACRAFELIRGSDVMAAIADQEVE